MATNSDVNSSSHNQTVNSEHDDFHLKIEDNHARLMESSGITELPSSLKTELTMESDDRITTCESTCETNDLSRSSDQRWSKRKTRGVLRGVIGMTFYLMLGSVIFSACELPMEKDSIKQMKHELEKKSRDLTLTLINETIDSVCSAENRTDCFHKVDFVELEKVTIALVNDIVSKAGIDEFEVGGNDSDITVNWDVPGAFYFCITTVTTIGYGNFAPSSRGTQLLTIFYALLGIPGFFFTCSQLSRLFRFISYSIRRKLNCLGTNKRKRAVAYYIVVVVISFFLLFIAPLPLYVINYKLSPVTALYFIFVSLSTIGYGDIYPTNPGSQRFDDQLWNRLLYSVLLWVYMLVGLSLFGTVLTVLQSWIDKLSRKLTSAVDWIPRKTLCRKTKVVDISTSKTVLKE